MKSLILMITSFIGTNIDDIFIDTIFFAQADDRKKQWAIVAGKYLGIGILVFVSWIGASVLHAVPGNYLGVFGVIPILLGINVWLNNRKNTGQTMGEDDEAAREEMPDASKGLLMSVVLVTVSNGADNLGVYIPLFASYTGVQMVLCVLVFALMVAVWCVLSKRLADLPGMRSFLLKNKSWIVPVVFIALGIYIILEGLTL